MAEYWKSAPKFWCKQCKIYIRDTSFEKSQHEASAKHQSSLKRFLRDIHRDNEREQRDSQRAKNEVERLKQTVSGNGPPGKRTAAPPPPSTHERPGSLDERKKQMAQLVEMGVAIPEEYRRDMALAGDWQTTSVKVIRDDNEEGNPAAKSIGVRKRKAEGDADGEEEQEEPERFVSKGWGSTVRKYPGAQSEDEDLDALLASTKNVKKVKPSKEDEGPEEEGVKKETADDGAPTKSEGEEAAAPAPESEQASIKQEEPSDTTSAPAPVKNETEEPEPTGGVVFKKRKPKAMRK
ncbi:putative formin binding protein [Aspergillus glaucus CBS 516.65]|uniref:U1-type domain-containing protein n=1 Tax=Aspergillus glaucus CBS 516.65 TaxID=1160497 RepID=A0A1L9VE22_ASPGL|nr:hypothetical protein ASPGLDRAFT_175692 [Aspergillus glaucus CBS 516.65]OJJ82177.1 hypothetical protein ASPGLDRAFT_175692 [Aspergillus glaucus CBS 516.65]